MFCIYYPEDVAAKITENWTVQRQNEYAFSSVACDQTIEQTLNRLVDMLITTPSPRCCRALSVL